MKSILNKSSILVMVAWVLIGLLISFSQALIAAPTPGTDGVKKGIDPGAAT